ncbi:MAG: orotidine 5'-phosphate decarboxylase / HUMPS family protein, partial [Caldisphaera sp.]|nr:orotidine 5'-phosphate decarboxylase / HUMPS family protein [Caldisphaera sp.]
MTLIVAIDRSNTEDGKDVIYILSNICNMVTGIKLGLPLLLKHDLTLISKINEICKNNLIIADLKLADIGDVMIETVKI